MASSPSSYAPVRRRNLYATYKHENCGGQLGPTNYDTWVCRKCGERIFVGSVDHNIDSRQDRNVQKRQRMHTNSNVY